MLILLWPYGLNLKKNVQSENWKLIKKVSWSSLRDVELKLILTVVIYLILITTKK
jgi:hypothetical protein